MKSGIRTLFEGLIEDSIASSLVLSKVTSSIQTVAIEMKRLAEIVLKMNERMNQQEKIIIELCNIQSEKSKNNKTIDFVTLNKETQKPN